MDGAQVVEQIPVHLAVSLDDAGSLRAFRNRWRQMPEPTRERFRLVVRQALDERWPMAWAAAR